MTDTAQIIAGLIPLVDEGRVLTDADSLKHYGCDWTKKFEPRPLAVVLPKTTEQVQAIVRYANAHKLALVPSGGRTGLTRKWCHGASLRAGKVDAVRAHGQEQAPDYHGPVMYAGQHQAGKQ